MMTIEELKEQLQSVGIDTVNKACIDMANRGIGYIKAHEITRYAERQGTLSATVSALFTAYVQIKEMEKGNAGSI